LTLQDNFFTRQNRSAISIFQNHRINPQQTKRVSTLANMEDKKVLVEAARLRPAGTKPWSKWFTRCHNTFERRHLFIQLCR